MTTIDVASYDDLRGDEVLHSRGKDVVLKELEAGADAVLYIEDWLIPEKSFSMLGSVAGLENLVPGRVVAETEKALLFTQTDDRDPAVEAPGTDWVPKSHSRVYLADLDVDDDGEPEYTVPQRGLDEYTG